MEMNNPFTTPIFQSSSSSTTPRSSHTNLLMNMMLNKDSDHRQIFQLDDHTINNNSTKPSMNTGMMEIPRSTTLQSTIINYSTSTRDDDDHDIDIYEAAGNNNKASGEAIATAAAAAADKEKAGDNKNCRKPKYAFQTRSQVDILDDGYRWRKYGQKAVKNNKFPRSYYRCTHQGCNVKKQIQRLSKDEGIVVTTYEGMHSHPIDKSTDNFEHILTQMQIYPAY